MRHALVFVFTTNAIMANGCSSRYVPTLTARGELTVQVSPYRGLEFWAGRKRIAQTATGYRGLSDYVYCVPLASAHARKAETLGKTALAFSALAAVSAMVGVVHSVVGLTSPQVGDPQMERLYGLYGAFSVGLLTTRDWVLVPHGMGNALDAANYYNDAVGSFGATCKDPSYPPPVLVTPNEPNEKARTVKDEKE